MSNVHSSIKATQGRNLINELTYEIYICYLNLICVVSTILFDHVFLVKQQYFLIEHLNSGSQAMKRREAPHLLVKKHLADRHLVDTA